MSVKKLNIFSFKPAVDFYGDGSGDAPLFCSFSWHLSATNSEIKNKKLIAFKPRFLLFTFCFLLFISFTQKTYSQTLSHKDSLRFQKAFSDSISDVKKEQLHDSLKAAKKARKDSIAIQKNKYFLDSSFSPHLATIHSAMLPGWGQVYNKQAWKVPFVYAGLGITAGVFFYNISSYKELKNAYYIRINDTANWPNLPPNLLYLSTNSIKFYRDQVRHNIDLSVLAFLIAWGLNVADASVTAHLKQFDVSDDLSLRIKPTLNYMHQPGLSLTFNFKDKNKTLRHIID